MRQGAFQVERADHPIFCSTQGQVNHRHHDQMAFGGGGASFVAGSSVRQAVWTLGIFWVATVLATHHGAHFGQQSSQGPHGRGFASAAITEHQNAPDAGVDGCQHDGQFHVVLANDGREGEGQRHLVQYEG